jgi:trans-2,3-dihydro-3-hydroxyanthranilate isomerase
LFNFDGPWDGTRSWTIAQGEDMGRASLIELEVDAHGNQLNAIRVGGHAVRISQGTLAV